MISKELLSAVLGKEVTLITNDMEWVEENNGEDMGKNDVFISFLQTGFDSYQIVNIYELAHKVKEWAKDKGYLLLSGIYTFNGKYDSHSCLINQNFSYEDDGEFIKRDESCLEGFDGYTTEPEAIFKAGEWVLEQESR